MSDIMHVWCCTCPYPPSLPPSLSQSLHRPLPHCICHVCLFCLDAQTDMWTVTKTMTLRTGQDRTWEERGEEKSRVEGWDDTLLCGTRIKTRNTTYHHHSQSASSMSFSQYLSLTLYFLISFFLFWNTPKILQFSRAFLSFKISFISVPFFNDEFTADLCDRTNEKIWNQVREG